MAVSDTPAGQYDYLGRVRHADGTVLGERAGDLVQFDPGIFIDDDGEIYLYSGNGPVRPEKYGGQHGSQVMSLEPDMLTLKTEPKPLLPSTMESAGTGFEEHEFYEASSIRKINGRYYLVYSSVKSSELCYAVSNRPDGGYRFGGTLVDIGDIGYAGRARRDAVNMLGNTHGGLEQIGGQWYVFYHRQTDRSNFSRQGCAERIAIDPDGRIPQVEVTSCGLNGEPLKGTGTYPARICCHLTGRKPAVFSHPVSMKMDYPFLTQDVPDIEPGCPEASEEEKYPVQYIRNMCDGAVAGYKYFSFQNKENEEGDVVERLISVTVRGNARGVLRIRTEEKGTVCGEITVSVCGSDWMEYMGRFRTSAGVHGLYFQYEGTGSFELLSFAMK